MYNYHINLVFHTLADCVVKYLPSGQGYILSPVVIDGQALPAGHLVQLVAPPEA